MKEFLIGMAFALLVTGALCLAAMAESTLVVRTDGTLTICSTTGGLTVCR
jgi:hypothetical protein